MSTATSSPPDARTASAASFLDEICAPLSLPTAAVIYGPPGSGKTSLGASAPAPVFLTDDQELGIHTLIGNGRIDKVPVMPPCATWQDVHDAIDKLTEGDHDRKTLVVDTIGGIERLCFEHVVTKQFRNEWGEKGFAGYGRGVECSLPEWRRLVKKLDKLRISRQMSVVLLGHSTVKPFKNPEGEDFDRYQIDMHAKTWAITSKWSDMVLFLNFHMQTDESGKRVKGKGGQVRFLNTEHHAAYDAKNRHGLPAMIPMGSSGSEAWNNLIAAITEARSK